MNTLRNYVYQATRSTKARPAGWYVVRANDKGIVKTYLSGPFKTFDEVMAAFNKRA